ncbi:putative membrane protein YczE [Arthrobacter sp. SORGH_AS 212]|uniref:membrane protein YczE n=1 Tax=Pseudarthrobacter sp. SORGH_AS 212 TaxID=3041777 RepID=UPI00278054F6|nr:putative membrane protein YczE [Arthrobacter sp. SORGH_AS_0212]
MMLRRIVQLFTGLAMYGISLALFIRAGLGLDPWDVFHQGVANRTGLSIGVVVIIVSFLVLLLWIPLRQRPGFGTLCNAILVGVFADVGLALIPSLSNLAGQVGMLAGAILLNGIASACYIGARFGPGARDGLMTGLARRTGWSVRMSRTLIEVAVLAAGWLLGGSVGVGTVLYALAIGPLVQLLLPWFMVPAGAPKVARAARSDGKPDGGPEAVGEPSYSGTGWHFGQK